MNGIPVRSMVAAIVAILVTGCVRPTPRPPLITKPPVVELRYWAPDADALDPDLTAAFEAAHPGVKVLRVTAAWPPEEPALPRTADVVVVPPGQVGALARQGLLRELTADITRGADDFANQELANSLFLDGKRYDLPLTVNPLVVFTWPDLAGRPPQLRWFWHEFADMAARAATHTTPDGSPLYGAAVYPSAAPLLRAMAIQSFLSDGRYPLPDVLYLNMQAGAMQDGITVLKGLFPGAVYTPPAGQATAAIKLFVDRRAAMLVTDYASGYAALAGVQGWDVHLTPRLYNMHVPVAWVTSVAVAADTSDPKLAFALAAYMSSPTVEQRLAGRGLLPARNDLQPNWLMPGGHLVSYPRSPSNGEAQFAAALDSAAEALAAGVAQPDAVIAQLSALRKGYNEGQR